MSFVVRNKRKFAKVTAIVERSGTRPGVCQQAQRGLADKRGALNFELEKVLGIRDREMEQATLERSQLEMLCTENESGENLVDKSTLAPINLDSGKSRRPVLKLLSP